MLDSRSCSVAVALFLLAEVAVAQSVHHVGPGGIPTIQAAIDGAAPGDVVQIDAGVYAGFDVGKSMTIVASPSAYVQIVAPAGIHIALSPTDRVQLGGLDLDAAEFTIQGGSVSAERCTVRTVAGLRIEQTFALLRWCSVWAAANSGVHVHDAHLHASESSFATAAGSSATERFAAIAFAGTCTSGLSTCSVFGAWPAGSSPSAALDVANLVTPNHRIWVHACSLIGGFDQLGNLGPAIVAPTPPTQAPVRLFDCQVSGGSIGAVDHGPVLGIRTSLDMKIGETFTTTIVGEPGHFLLFYAGTSFIGQIPIPFAEQPALGLADMTTVDVKVGDAQGDAAFSLFVPNNPSLRHVVFVWRGLDLSVAPWQVSPAFATIVQ